MSITKALFECEPEDGHWPHRCKLAENIVNHVNEVVAGNGI
jgi:hypothetical protein